MPESFQKAPLFNVPLFPFVDLSITAPLAVLDTLVSKGKLNSAMLSPSKRQSVLLYTFSPSSSVTSKNTVRLSVVTLSLDVALRTILLTRGIDCTMTYAVVKFVVWFSEA